MWNNCISNILDKPVLSTVSIRNKDFSFIIPGSNSNSDMTMTVGLFKNRMKRFLLSSQKAGDSDKW